MARCWRSLFVMKWSQKMKCIGMLLSVMLFAIAMSSQANSQDVGHVRLDKVRDQIGRRVTYRIKPDDPPEKCITARVMGWSKEQFMTATMKMVPKYVYVIPDEQTKQVLLPNPIYVATPD